MDTGVSGTEKAVKVGIVTILFSVVLFVASSMIYNGPSNAYIGNTMFSESKVHPYHGSFNMDTCGCELPTTGDACSNPSYPVMGGLDPVQYFSFKKENMVGKVGSSEYQYTYAGYTYYFLNEENRQTFISNPDKYKPQWGGFCSWGMSAEFCPNFTWSSSCLGPSGNWAIWTIQHDQSDNNTAKLYFFYLNDVRDSFLANKQFYIDQVQYAVPHTLLFPLSHLVL
jgi:YHS domain-containing protein